MTFKNRKELTLEFNSIYSPTRADRILPQSYRVH